MLRRMQQLVGDRTDVTDGEFICELFLQCLPSNVHMVLASACITATSLDQLADLADKVVEVATPTIAATATVPQFPQLFTEIEQLHSEV